jgi:hypothetical protein
MVVVAAVPRVREGVRHLRLPAAIVPRPASMDGQEPYWGCGSDAISCARESLLTNVTVCPTGTVTLLALTPAAVMVIVAPLAPPVPPSRTTIVTELGALGEPPPHEASRPSAASDPTKRARICLMC